MASGPITSWQIDGGKKMKTVTDFIFLGSKITVNCDCSHGIQSLLAWKAMRNLDSIFKSRDITLSTKVHIAKDMVFPVVMWCESWTIKKVEHRRIDAFKLWAGEDSSKSLGLQEIKPVSPKGSQPWIFNGRTELKLKL